MTTIASTMRVMMVSIGKSVFVTWLSFAAVALSRPGRRDSGKEPRQAHDSGRSP